MSQKDAFPALHIFSTQPYPIWFMMELLVWILGKCETLKNMNFYVLSELHKLFKDYLKITLHTITVNIRVKTMAAWHAGRRSNPSRGDLAKKKFKLLGQTSMPVKKATKPVRISQNRNRINPTWLTNRHPNSKHSSLEKKKRKRHIRRIQLLQKAISHRTLLFLPPNMLMNTKYTFKTHGAIFNSKALELIFQQLHVEQTDLITNPVATVLRGHSSQWLKSITDFFAPALKGQILIPLLAVMFAIFDHDLSQLKAQQLFCTLILIYEIGFPSQKQPHSKTLDTSNGTTSSHRYLKGGGLHDQITYDNRIANFSIHAQKMHRQKEIEKLEETAQQHPSSVRTGPSHVRREPQISLKSIKQTLQQISEQMIEVKCVPSNILMDLHPSTTVSTRMVDISTGPEVIKKRHVEGSEQVTFESHFEDSSFVMDASSRDDEITVLQDHRPQNNIEICTLSDALKKDSNFVTPTTIHQNVIGQKLKEIAAKQSISKQLESVEDCLPTVLESPPEQALSLLVQLATIPQCNDSDIRHHRRILAGKIVDIIRQRPLPLIINRDHIISLVLSDTSVDQAIDDNIMMVFQALRSCHSSLTQDEADLLTRLLDMTPASKAKDLLNLSIKNKTNPPEMTFQSPAPRTDAQQQTDLVLAIHRSVLASSFTSSVEDNMESLCLLLSMELPNPTPPDIVREWQRICEDFFFIIEGKETRIQEVVQYVQQLCIDTVSKTQHHQSNTLDVVETCLMKYGGQLLAKESNALLSLLDLCKQSKRTQTLQSCIVNNTQLRAARQQDSTVRGIWTTFKNWVSRSRQFHFKRPTGLLRAGTPPMRVMPTAQSDQHTSIQNADTKNNDQNIYDDLIVSNTNSLINPLQQLLQPSNSYGFHHDPNNQASIRMINNSDSCFVNSFVNLLNSVSQFRQALAPRLAAQFSPRGRVSSGLRSLLARGDDATRHHINLEDVDMKIGQQLRRDVAHFHSSCEGGETDYSYGQHDVADFGDTFLRTLSNECNDKVMTNQLYRHRVEETFECSTCHAVNTTLDAYDYRNILGIAVTNETNSLQHELNKISQPESRLRNCSDTNCSGTLAICSALITEHPETLLVHLKRNIILDGLEQKLNSPIECENIIVINGIRYILSGFIVHIGPSVNSGHYRQYRVNADGRYICSDDQNEIRVVEKRNMGQLRNHAYLLAYSKSDDQSIIANCQVEVKSPEEDRAEIIVIADELSPAATETFSSLKKMCPQADEIHSNITVQRDTEVFEIPSKTAADILEKTVWSRTSRKRKSIYNSREVIPEKERRSDTEVCRIGDNSINLSSLHRLEPGTWFNDELINTIASLHLARSGERESIFIASSYFYAKLVCPVGQPENETEESKLERKYKDTRGYFKNTDLKTKDCIIIPICRENHWYSIVIFNLNKQDPALMVLNSSERFGDVCTNIKYITDFFRRMTGIQVNRSLTANLPQQSNDNDCGMFLLENIKELVNNPSNFKNDAINDTLISRYNPRNLETHGRSCLIRMIMELSTKQTAQEQSHIALPRCMNAATLFPNQTIEQKIPNSPEILQHNVTNQATSDATMTTFHQRISQSLDENCLDSIPLSDNVSTCESVGEFLKQLNEPAADVEIPIIENWSKEQKVYLSNFLRDQHGFVSTKSREEFIINDQDTVLNIQQTELKCQDCADKRTHECINDAIPADDERQIPAAVGGPSHPAWLWEKEHDVNAPDTLKVQNTGNETLQRATNEYILSRLVNQLQQKLRPEDDTKVIQIIAEAFPQSSLQIQRKVLQNVMAHLKNLKPQQDAPMHTNSQNLLQSSPFEDFLHHVATRSPQIVIPNLELLSVGQRIRIAQAINFDYRQKESMDLLIGAINLFAFQIKIPYVTENFIAPVLLCKIGTDRTWSTDQKTLKMAFDKASLNNQQCVIETLDTIIFQQERPYQFGENDKILSRTSPELDEIDSLLGDDIFVMSDFEDQEPEMVEAEDHNENPIHHFIQGFPSEDLSVPLPNLRSLSVEMLTEITKALNCPVKRRVKEQIMGVICIKVFEMLLTAMSDEIFDFAFNMMEVTKDKKKKRHKGNLTGAFKKAAIADQTDWIEQLQERMFPPHMADHLIESPEQPHFQQDLFQRLLSSLSDRDFNVNLSSMDQMSGLQVQQMATALNVPITHQISQLKNIIKNQIFKNLSARLTPVDLVQIFLPKYNIIKSIKKFRHCTQLIEHFKKQNTTCQFEMLKTLQDHVFGTTVDTPFHAQPTAEQPTQKSSHTAHHPPPTETTGIHLPRKRQPKGPEAEMITPEEHAVVLKRIRKRERKTMLSMYARVSTADNDAQQTEATAAGDCPDDHVEQRMSQCSLNNLSNDANTRVENMDVEDMVDMNVEDWVLDSDDSDGEETLLNPIIEAGKKIYEILLNIEYEECSVCNERWPGMEVGPRTKRCSRCSSNMKNLAKGVPLTFSYENDMDPCEQPEELRRLNAVETAAISIICPAQHIFKLRYGSVGQKGHSVSFAQDISEFAQRLPRSQPDLPYIIIKAPNQEIPLQANQHYIEAALKWLIQNSPLYKDIIIDQETLKTYPENRETNLTGVRCHNTAQPMEDEDVNEFAERVKNNQASFDPPVSQKPQGTTNGAEIQTEEEEEQDIDILNIVPSMMNMEVEQNTVHEFIKEAVLNPPGKKEITVDWPKRSAKPVSEFQEGYFSMAHPNLFCYGLADITMPRQGKKPEFLAWLRHLLHYKDGRFASDFRFVLNAVNMYRRHKALTLSNVYANKVCSDLTMEEIKQRVANDDQKIMKSLLYFGATIQGTRQYFSTEASKSISMERFVRIASGNEAMLNLFLTFSLPDLHMPELHRLLPGSNRYLNKIVVKNLSDIPAGANPMLYITKAEDFDMRRKALRDNPHIVNEIGYRKIQLFIKEVLENVMGVTHWILRSEFQSRGALHWHMAGSMKGIHLEDMQRAFKKYRHDLTINIDIEPDEDDPVRREWEKMLEAHPIISAEEQVAVKESRKKVVDFTCNHVGITEIHPQPDPKLWPGPYGQAINAPIINCLTQDFCDTQLTEQLSNEDYERLVNRVQLHTCKRAYCQKLHAELKQLLCRFKFPKDTEGFMLKKSQTVPDESFYDHILLLDYVKDGATFLNSTLCMLRNHPRLTHHVPEILKVWRGNTDQAIIESIDAVTRYILKYILKPETKSHSFDEIVTHLTKTADDDTPIRKLFAKILMKSISEHDMSLNESMKITSGTDVVEYSHQIRYVGLTDNRLLNTQALADSTPTLARNISDRFFNRHLDENYNKFEIDYSEGNVKYPCPPMNISLYKYASDFNPNWTLMDKQSVPHPSPNFKYVPAVDDNKYRESYCKTTLLLHCPTAHPSNYLNNFETAEKALHDFVTNNAYCPPAVRADYLKSLTCHQDQQKSDNNVQQLVASQMSQVEEHEQDSEMIGLGTTARYHDLNAAEPIDDMCGDENYNDVDTANAGVDWNQDSHELGLTIEQVESGSGDWIDLQRDTAPMPELILDNVDPDTLNLDQRRAFDMIKGVIDMVVRKQDAKETDTGNMQHLIDISGAAGSGKTYTLKAMLKYAFDKTGHHNTIQVAAPTGSAAQLLPKGRTIHDLLKLDIRDGYFDHQQDLTGPRLALLQHDFQDSHILVLDEKGMIGLGRMSQIHRRLCQAKPHSSDLPFGGMTIMLAGDLRQLPAVKDLPLYSASGGTLVQIEGRVMYRKFEISFIFHNSIRQAGDENKSFREELERLANGDFNLNDYKSWTKRSLSNLNSEEKRHFEDNAVKLCSLKNNTVSFNIQQMRKLETPIFRVKSINSKGASTATSTVAKNLLQELLICRGCKIVLTINLWTAAKLVNGSPGVVKHVIFKSGETPPNHQPAFLLVQFEGYTGPPFLPGHPKLVPICPVTKTWMKKEQVFSRTQLPLMLGFAISIHKSQGEF